MPRVSSLRRLIAPGKKINQSAQCVQTKHHQHPDQPFIIGEPRVFDAIEQHPNPERQSQKQDDLTPAKMKYSQHIGPFVITVSLSRFEYLSTATSFSRRPLVSPCKQVNQRAQGMEEKDDQHPDDSLGTRQSGIHDAINQHPNPEDE
jgi:hypothetical protein